MPEGEANVAKARVSRYHNMVLNSFCARRVGTGLGNIMPDVSDAGWRIMLYGCT